MNRFKTTCLLLIAVFAVSITSLKAQEKNKIKIAKFEDGRVIKQEDIGLLSWINNDKSKDAGKKTEVVYGKNTFKVGHKLTKEEASVITAKLDEFSKANKLETTKTGEASAQGYNCPCCCYRVVCDVFGNCWTVCSWC